MGHKQRPSLAEARPAQNPQEREGVNPSSAVITLPKIDQKESGLIAVDSCVQWSASRVPPLRQAP